MTESMKFYGKELLYPFFIRNMPAKLTGYDAPQQYANTIKTMMIDTIAEHKRTKESGQPPRVITS